MSMTANMATDEEISRVVDDGPDRGWAPAEELEDAGERLADVREAVLDDEQLRALLSDIATYGQVRELSVKAAPRARPDAITRLPELYLKLVQRRVFGAQIRYDFEDKSWLDTLIATPEGLRLVRVELPQ
jgi:hypothetical protein